MLALQSTFVAERATELHGSYELRLGKERFSVDVTATGIDIGRGNARKPDAIIETDTATLRAVVFGDLELTGAPLEIRGDARRARALLRSFARP